MGSKERFMQLTTELRQREAIAFTAAYKISIDYFSIFYQVIITLLVLYNIIGAFFMPVCDTHISKAQGTSAALSISCFYLLPSGQYSQGRFLI